MMTAMIGAMNDFIAIPTSVKLREESAELNIGFKDIKQFVGMLSASGDLVKLSEDIYVSSEVLESGKEKLKKSISAEGGLKLGRISEILDSSRKFMVPLMEYLDRIGFTIRKGDIRELL